MPPRLNRLLAAAVGVALAGPLLTVLPANAQLSAPTTPTTKAATSVALADPGASKQTRSLFAYLKGQEGDGILFGHQHTTTDGATVTDPTALDQSDVKASVGDYPAVFGWDGLAFDGDEKPGVPGNTRTQNARLLAKAFVKSDALGGINTLSLHMPNFVTGGNFNDTGGDVVSAILPGGSKNAEYRNYLNAVALSATAAQRSDGNLVPIIFRPLHENNGSWFWWGAGHASASAYINLYRYTVEYLRDIKGVHNFLYAYSPNASFGGDPTNYLKTYPGDAYVDILGYDGYDVDADADAGYLSGLTKDLAMVVTLADERAKVPALTEFGPTPNFKPTGNPNPNWYTDVLEALAADPVAKRVTYALTWANWSADSVYVPYPATNGQPANEMLGDFRTFAADPYTVFAKDLSQPYSVKTKATAGTPIVRLVTPWSRSRITTSPYTVRTRVIGKLQSKVYFEVADGPTIELKPDRQGFYSGTWRITPGWLDNRAVTVSTKAKVNGQWRSDTAKVFLGEKPALAPGWVDDFEGYAGDDESLNEAYGLINGASLALSDAHKAAGSYGAAYSYDFSSASYAGISKSVNADWSAYSTAKLWLQGDGSDNGMTVQIVADGVYFEHAVSLSNTTGQYLSLDFSSFAPAPWDTSHVGQVLDAAHLAKVTQFNLYTGQGGNQLTGTIYLDNLRAE